MTVVYCYTTDYPDKMRIDKPALSVEKPELNESVLQCTFDPKLIHILNSKDVIPILMKTDRRTPNDRQLVKVKWRAVYTYRRKTYD